MLSSNLDHSQFGPSDIWKARRRLQHSVWHTPLVFSSALSRRTHCQVYLKMECWQICGCFKVRGAINMVTALSQAEQARGLVTASSGNHGIAVAYAAAHSGGLSSTVFVPQDADPTKVKKMRALGAQVRFHGENYLEAYAAAQQFSADQGTIFVHSHAHPHVMAGQGTIGLEILEDLPDVTAVLVPVGGGGLISGIATAVKSASREVKIFGIEPSAAPAAYMSLRDGVCYEEIEIKPSLADGLLGGFGRLPFEVSRHLIEDVFLVEEDEIAAAMRILQQDEQLMVEAASAVGLAALLSGKTGLSGEQLVLVLTSRNIDAAKFNRVIKGSKG